MFVIRGHGASSLRRSQIRSTKAVLCEKEFIAQEVVPSRVAKDHGQQELKLWAGQNLGIRRNSEP